LGLSGGHWLTVGEAAKFIGVSEPTLRKWTDAGRIAAFRTPGGHRRYLRAELEQFKVSRREDRIEDGAEPSANGRP
jgi:excisionase family DNA binding protein